MQRLRVLLADDHVLVAEGIRTLVEREHEVVGTRGRRPLSRSSSRGKATGHHLA
jgi:hypothetical protein